MRYAQFYKPSTGYIPGSIPPRFDPAYVMPIEACGDRALIIIDARMRPSDAGRIAAQECRDRGFIGWRMYEGASISSAKPVSGYWPVSQGAEDKSALSAYRGF